jgi:hydroxyacylglutathione hydrolase
LLTVKQFVNNPYTSNTFILEEDNSADVYLIDAGFTCSIKELIGSGKNINGVFLTHAHYDHIHGINEVIKVFPDCLIFCSEGTKQGLFNEKLNLSFYHEEPITLKSGKILSVANNDNFVLFGNYELKVLETPGHNKGSLSFIVSNYFFTGDSYIPNIPVVTKLKGGDKEANLNSLALIFDACNSETTICPGHGPKFKDAELKQAMLIDSKRYNLGGKVKVH